MYKINVISNDVLIETYEGEDLKKLLDNATGNFRDCVIEVYRVKGKDKSQIAEIVMDYKTPILDWFSGDLTEDEKEAIRDVVEKEHISDYTLRNALITLAKKLGVKRTTIDDLIIDTEKKIVCTKETDWLYT